MAFIEISEMKTHIYPGVQNLITQADDTIVTSAIDAAIAEAKGYLSRYDLVALFEGSTRDPMLVTTIKNIAKWHFMALGNVNIDYQDALNRYDSAIKYLSGIQSGKIVPAGWVMATPQERSQLWHVKSSTPKRNNHFTPNSNNPFNPNNQ